MRSSQVAWFCRQKRSKLQFKKVRDTNGTDWQTAYTRIQQRIDVTDQAYIQFNGSDNQYGMELGTTSDQKFARFTRAEMASSTT